MKRLIIFSLVGLIGLAGCGGKANIQSEWWTWEGKTYTAGICGISTDSVAGYGRTTTLTVQNGSNTLQFIFFGSLPSSSCIDTVGPWGSTGDPNIVTISMANNGATYQSTGGNGTNETVHVNVSSGVVSVSTITPVVMQNIATASTDSSTLTFNLIQ